MKLTPFPYQRKSIREIDRFGGRVLLAHSMGLGKTLIALWWWQQTSQTSPGLVVCPASVKYVWESEAINNIGICPHVIEGNRTNENSMNGRPKLIVINYDVLTSWMEWLKKYRFKSLFIDECHYCKNPQTKRSQAVRELAKGIRNVIALSGTPFTNRPIELFPVLQMLRPKTFPSLWNFGCEFCGPTVGRSGIEFKGARRKKELHQLLKQTCMIRYRKKDVLPELPEKNRRVLTVGLRNEEEYREAKDHFLRWLTTIDPLKVKKAERAKALVQLGYLIRLTAKGKLWYVVQWANRWLAEYPDEKLIVFAVHRKMIEALKRRIEAKSVVVDGRVTGRKRQSRIDQFQQDERTRVFVGNIRAAGVGLTLTIASTLAFAELSWVPADHTQAEARPYRIGQEKVVWIWYLVAAGTIEEDLCEILQTKQRVSRSVLDGGRGDDLDVYSQLMMKLGKGLLE